VPPFLRGITANLLIRNGVNAQSQVDRGAAPDDGDGGADTTGGWTFWKQDRHRTGRPCVGRNGTVVSVPHAEHLVRVSALTLGPPLARFALHCLQRLGSFLKSLSWKKSCSPAVKTNSEPQSIHFNTLSVNSMAGFPTAGKCANRPWPLDLPVRFPATYV